MARFAKAIRAASAKEHLTEPSPDDIVRLLAQAETCGLPGMLRSLDYMHWTWKNCPRPGQGSSRARRADRRSCWKRLRLVTLDLARTVRYAGGLNDINIVNVSTQLDNLLCAAVPR